jgi:hypothetical protein
MTMVQSAELALRSPARLSRRRFELPVEMGTGADVTGPTKPVSSAQKRNRLLTQFKFKRDLSMTLRLDEPALKDRGPVRRVFGVVRYLERHNAGPIPTIHSLLRRQDCRVREIRRSTRTDCPLWPRELRGSTRAASRLGTAPLRAQRRASTPTQGWHRLRGIAPSEAREG